MEWLLQNWFWVVVFVAFFAMHLFGHGGHGSHSGGCSGGHGSHKDKDAKKVSTEKPTGHQH